MEIGSPEHKRLLLNSILKMALKTAGLGFTLGVMLMIPSVIRLNDFSSGLALAGQFVIAVSLAYALTVAIKNTAIRLAC